MSDRTFEIRGETRLKNGRLVRAREESGLDQKSFAKLLGMSYGAYNAYENMREYPIPKHRKILANYCDCTEEELFPVELQKYAEGEEPRILKQIAIIEPSRLLGAVRREVLLASVGTTPSDEFDAKERKEQIALALAKIREKDAEAIVLRYGLKSGESMTLDEVGVRMRCTKENVRRRVERGLSDLRRAGTSRCLELFHDMTGTIEVE